MIFFAFLMFTSYGEIDSIRVLHERFCAFVNFKNANMASRAMEKLNVSETLMIFQYKYFIYLCVKPLQNALLRDILLRIPD